MIILFLARTLVKSILTPRVSISFSPRPSRIISEVMNPILFNAALTSYKDAGPADTLSFRRSCIRHYAVLEENAGLCRASANLRYNPHTRRWDARPFHKHELEDGDTSVPVNTFDKIKVAAGTVCYGNYATNQVVSCPYAVKDMGEDGKARNIFPEEVIRSAMPAASVTRYKTVCTDQAVTNVNVTLSKGVHDRQIVMRTLQHHVYRSSGGYAFCRPLMSDVSLCNNSVTVDAAVACVSNEMTFRSRAIRDGLFERKADFKTAAYIMKTACNDDEDDYVDYAKVNVMGCTCSKCSEDARLPNSQHSIRRRMTAGTFRRRDTAKRAGAVTARSDFMSAALRPLRDGFEVQVHSRSLNSSAITGHAMMPAVCKLSATLMNPNDGVAEVDEALAYLSGAMELRTNGLLPSHLADVAETMCWLAETRLMDDPRDRVAYARSAYDKFLSRVRSSRRNFAQSAGFAVRAGLGNPYVFGGDDRVRLLRRKTDREKKRLRALKTKTEPPLIGRGGGKIVKNLTSIRRRCGIVYRASLDTDYAATLIRYGGKAPLDSDR